MAGKVSGFLLSVGVEVHAELLTESKMFCRCPVSFGGEPNTRTCPTCLGLPGALPVLNRQAVELGMRAALALNCTVPNHSIFHRKNYFYADLPKGYQTTQYGETNPIGYHGYLEIPINGSIKRVNIRRVHLEEDTGKLTYLEDGSVGIDYNRAGVPLLEIVTEYPPDISSADEAREYAQQLRKLLVALNVCDGKMEQGSLRAEPNVSLRRSETEPLGTKTELKNLSSFRNLHRGIEFERVRQGELLNAGLAVLQETRGWDENKEESYLMRTKEEENDYRYFPCPDLVPMSFSEAEIERERAKLPELPLAKWRRYQEEFLLSAYDAELLTASPEWSLFFEQATPSPEFAKDVCNFMNGDLARLINENPGKSKINPEQVTALAERKNQGKISSKIAKQLLEHCFFTGESVESSLETLGLSLITDEAQISAWISEVLGQNPKVVEEYRMGQTKVMGFFVGEIMKRSGGRADPALVQSKLLEELS